MTFLWCVAVFFGVAFLAKAAWMFYLLVIKRERVDGMDDPVSGWGTPTFRDYEIPQPTPAELPLLSAHSPLPSDASRRT